MECTLRLTIDLNLSAAKNQRNQLGLGLAFDVCLLLGLELGLDVKPGLGLGLTFHLKSFVGSSCTSGSAWFSHAEAP